MHELVIDIRERELIDMLQDIQVDFKVELLDIGDILFRDGEQVILIIERKTVNDLKASICDGRAREQKARLMSCVDIARILYVVEGNLSKPLDTPVSGVDVSTLVGSLINTLFRDNIKVYKTVSLSETANFIKRLSDKLNTCDRVTYFQSDKGTMDDAKYASTLKKRKKDNMTPSVWFICQLSLIPQVTEIIASSIVNVYPSINDLVSAYNQIEDEERRISLLANLTYPIKNDKVRSVGKKNSERIYKFIYGKI
jgi:crossover junction endonuclease MUS81